MKLIYLKEQNLNLSSGTYSGTLEGWHYTTTEITKWNDKEIIIAGSTMAGRDPVGVYFFAKHGSNYESVLIRMKYKCYHASVFFKKALDWDTISETDVLKLYVAATEWAVKTGTMVKNDSWTYKHSLLGIEATELHTSGKEEWLQVALERLPDNVYLNTLPKLRKAAWVRIKDMMAETIAYGSDAGDVPSRHLTKFLLEMGFDGVKDIQTPFTVHNTEAQFFTFYLSRIKWGNQCVWMDLPGHKDNDEN